MIYTCVVFAAQLAWTDSDVVNIRVDRPDGQKLIVLKEGSDLHIVCETPADEGVSAEWWFNGYTRLTSESDRVELTQRRATVDGQLKHEYVLIMRRTTTNDRGSYKCEFGSLSDEVNVKITKLASICRSNCLHPRPSTSYRHANALTTSHEAG